ncbi:MAG TPA: Asp-tRNA(Asn)/Glu-tRNA(Gln) amidotransferase subunit GatC, partial [Methanoregulaceae archaeon]|nr:Asp-tRNA(Asn)/Glu-tRNA(Gln) amidotransferase subunit GatC [Methanoregulaceae archaeon]
MVSEKDVAHIAELADIGIEKEELAEFTGRFNEILDYFDILDQV